MHIPQSIRLALLALLSLSVVSGCAGESGKDGKGAQGGAEASTAKSGGASKPRASTDGMVAAVSVTGKPGAPVELKFDIAARPELGKPLAVTVAVVPRSADIAQLRVVFQSNESVEVQSGSEMPVQERPADGASVPHVVTVVPRREGVLYLGAVALIEGAGGSVARSFAIPIIVGDPVQVEQALAAKPAQGALAKGADGEKIISLPATDRP